MKCPSCSVELTSEKSSNWKCEICEEYYFSMCKHCFVVKLKRSTQCEEFSKLYDGKYEKHFNENHTQINIS